MPTYTQQLQALANEYMHEHGEATTKEIAVWAIRAGRWEPHPDVAARQCAEDIGRAMREEYVTDSSGRKVRVKHVARIKKGSEQLNLWADIRTAPREHMQIAFQQRRQQIVGDCVQLKLDVDSYNEHFNDGDEIQMIFDFRDDLEEKELVPVK